jgi:hypothetical protein
MKATRSSDISARLRRLQELKPEWALDYSFEEGEPILRIFVYRCRADRSKGIDDLKKVKTLSFPLVEGYSIFMTPDGWIDDMIRRLTTVHA